MSKRRGSASDPIGPTTEISPYFTAWRLVIVDIVESITTPPRRGRVESVISGRGKKKRLGSSKAAEKSRIPNDRLYSSIFVISDFFVANFPATCHKDARKATQRERNIPTIVYFQIPS